jgi:hypothetical protein
MLAARVYEEELKLRLTPIDLPLSVNKIYNDATSLGRQSPSGDNLPQEPSRHL